MEKISVSKLVEYTRKSHSSKITIINNLKKTSEKADTEGGGNYWVHSTGTIAKVYTTGMNKLLIDKIEVLIQKFNASALAKSKIMFQKNVNILQGFEEFDFSEFKPDSPLNFLTRPKGKSILELLGDRA